MKTNIVLNFGWFSVLFFLSLNLLFGQIQPSENQYIVKTNDGNTYTGIVVREDNEKIELKTTSIGTITIFRTNINAIDLVSKTGNFGEKQKYWFDNPHQTRYFFGTNGYGLKKGEGYYQNTWIFFNQVSMGLTDNLTLGVGTIPVFLFTIGNGGAATPVWITPKISFPVQKDKFNIAAGTLFLTIVGENESAGVLYGVTTFGSRNKNTSIGLGWGYSDGEIANSPTISLSHITRTRDKWAFLTENYLLGLGDGENVLLLSGGARFMAKRLALDFGGVTFILLEGGQDIFPILPWLSIAVPFGGNK